LDPAAAPKGGQTAQGKPGSATLRRIRKAQSGAEGPAIADGLADALADSERENQPENAAEHGQQSDAGYQRYTPEQKGKQKVVEMLEDTGPSGLHEALTPAQAAKQQSAAAFTPALRSSGLPPSKRRRLQKANGQTVKVSSTPALEYSDVVWKIESMLATARHAQRGVDPCTHSISASTTLHFITQAIVSFT